MQAKSVHGNGSQTGKMRVFLLQYVCREVISVRQFCAGIVIISTHSDIAHARPNPS